MQDNQTTLLEDSTITYIVRVWLERREIEDAQLTWRGSIQHLPSGKTKYLTDLDEIARFIRPYLDEISVVQAK